MILNVKISEERNFIAQVKNKVNVRTVAIDKEKLLPQSCYVHNQYTVSRLTGMWWPRERSVVSSRKHGDVCREKGNRKKVWKEGLDAVLNHTESELIT